MAPALGALAWLWCVPAAAAAPPEAPPVATTRVRVAIDPGRRRVRGHVSITLENRSTGAIDRAYVWLYPNRLARRSAGLGDVNYYWTYPHAFNPGSMRITAARAGEGGASPVATTVRAEPHAAAGRNVLWSVALPHPVAAGGRLTLELDFEARVPERYGPFGCIDGTCTLIGGFYPMLAAHGAGGWDLEGPPQRGRVDVSVELPHPGSVVIFDHWSGNGVRRASAGADDVPYASLFVAHRWFETVRETAGAVQLRYLATHPPPPAEDARGKILPYTQEDYTRYALDTAEKAVTLLEATKVGPAAGTHLTLIEAPLRQDLAMAQPGGVIISDRWYRIFPANRFRKFHDRELVRAIADWHFGRRIERAGREKPRDVPVASDMIGAYLADLFTLQQHKKNEFAGDILQPVSFVPVVDQLLYAPQTMFASSYFGGVVDDEVLRDRPERFNHTRPRGRLYYEKLRDLLSAEALSRTMESMIRSNEPYRQAAEDAYGGSLDWFFRQWSMPYPRVNYKLVGSKTRKRADGLFVHEITVAKEVAPGDQVPVEPVEVLVVLRNGVRHHLRWDGAGMSKTLQLVATAKIDQVEVDPRGRLVEADLDRGDQHPLFDNRDHHPLRFVYRSFGLLLNVTDLSALLALDFTLSRRYDTQNELRVTAWRSSSVKAGAFVEYRRAFGPSLDPDTLMSRAAVHLRLQRLNPSFFTSAQDQQRGATTLTFGGELRSDDRVFYFEPLHARALAMGADVTVTRRDILPLLKDDDLLVSGVASIRYTNVFTPHPNHTLGINATAHVALGDMRDRSQLIGAGGIAGLRGYAPAELFTRLRLMVRLEYRHWFAHDLSWNLSHYNIVRGIGGAFFVDVAAMSPCDGYNVFDKKALFGSVGYGLRFPYDSFGTLPFLMRVDVAVPVVKRPGRMCLGQAPEAQPPFMLYVSFEPPF